MIVVTGGAGFIGSVFVAKLNDEGRDDIIVVDELGTTEKWRNLVKRRYADYLDKNNQAWKEHYEGLVTPK